MTKLDSGAAPSRSAAARSSKAAFRTRTRTEGGARAVPACGLANRVRAVRKLARPALSPVCQELAARGAERFSATMKRGTGLSQRLSRPLARAAVERRKASASPKGARAARNANRRQRLARQRGNLPAPFGASPPLFLGRRIANRVFPFAARHSPLAFLAKLGARTKRAARERDCFFTSPRVRGEVD